MKQFHLSLNSNEIIRETIEQARKFIYLAIFQIHSHEIFNALIRQAKNGVWVEIITLPNDSVNEDIRYEVAQQFEELEKAGAIVHRLKWNVGDPGRTTTVTGRWYSFHGKFLVTDRAAVALSANLTQSNELDAVLHLTDHLTIQQFVDKFHWLKTTFITPDDGFSGNIRRRIMETGEAGNKLFSMPSGIFNQEFSNYWILHYPESIINKPDDYLPGLYITPFDGKAREIYEWVIRSASRFVYLSAESFTDPGFGLFLKKIATNNIDIRILANPSSMDFTDRNRSMYLSLLAYGIQFRKLNMPLHAKLVITDSMLCISSVNLNNMNLGFSKTRSFWRSNTETLYISTEIAHVSEAAKEFLLFFYQGIEIEQEFSRLLDKEVRSLATEIHGFNPDPAARRLLAQVMIRERVEAEKIFSKIGELIRLLTHHLHPNNNHVSQHDVFAALILYNLTATKMNFHQISEKIMQYDQDFSVNACIASLIDHRFIEKDEDNYYRIAITKILE